MTADLARVRRLAGSASNNEGSRAGDCLSWQTSVSDWYDLVMGRNSFSLADSSLPPNTGYRWVMLAIVYLSFLAYAVVFQSVPPILSLIAGDLRLSHAEAGLLMSLFALPGVFLSIPMGLLADRSDARNLVAGCLVALVIGTILVAVGPSFPILAIGRMIAGAGGLSLFVVGAQLVSHWFAGRELGMASGVYSTAVPIGTLASLGTLGALASRVGWRGALLTGVALSAVALAIFVALYRPPPTQPEVGPRRARGSALSTVNDISPAIWLVSAIWMLFNAAVISFITFGPDYFVARGYGIEMAGLLASFPMLLSPPLAPLIGYVLDRVGREELFIGIGGILVAVTISALSATDYPPILLLIPLSLGSALVPTPVFVLPPKILRPEHLGIGYGIVSTLLNLGVVVGPYLAGVARDVTGAYHVSLYLMSFFGLLVTALAGALLVVRSHTGVAERTL